MKLYLFHLTLLFLLTNSWSQQQSHIIKSLPGYPGDLPFTLETGYVGVGELEQVQLFYYLVESERDVGTDPLMLWLTGGPGCSGFSGLIFQIGPLAFNLSERSLESDIPKLQQNPYSWTKVASIIFVDSPVGTGFSYGTTSEAYYSNDTFQAAHIYDFLRKWMIKHPKFKNNPFYVSGDSYSGITIPIIVQDIIQGNEIGLIPKLNLKGYIIGNPVTERDAESNEVYEFAHRNSFLSDELYKSAQISCNGDFVNVDANNTKCSHNLQVMHQDINLIKSPQVLEHECYYVSPKPVKKLSPHKYQKRHPALTKGKTCREYYYFLAHSWANDEQVRKALHIREGSIGDWIRCNQSIAYELNVQFSFEYHMNISTTSIRVLIYSGDLDMRVPYIGTFRWINELKIPINDDDDWRPWFVDGQVAGYITKFISYPYHLTFSTIKGGGHTATEFKPQECRAMIERWLSLSPL